MALWHSIVAGDCVESIALRYGFYPATLWNHPENEPLRSARPNPHVLAPGDRMFIPDKRERDETAETGRRHVFRRKGVPAKLKVRLEIEGEPRAHVAYRLEIDGRDAGGGVTDDDGKIERWISPSAREAKLSIGKHEEYLIRLGHMPPLDAQAGVHARLKNLGYPVPRDVEADLSEALHDFQLDQELDATGELDTTTRARLGTAHGS